MLFKKKDKKEEAAGAGAEKKPHKKPFKKFRKLSTETKTKIVLLSILAVIILCLVGSIAEKTIKANIERDTVLLEGRETAEPFDFDYWNSPTATYRTETAVSDTAQSESVDSANDPVEVKESIPVSEGYTLNCMILDVGQSSAAVFESNGEYLVVDSGDRDHAQVIVAYLKEQGISQIKYVCFTHFDADHIGGSVGILKNFACENVWLAPYTPEETRTYISLMDTIRENGIAYKTPAAGTRFPFGSCEIVITGPITTYEDENSNSLSMYVTDGVHSVFIGGDATTESESDMINAGEITDCDVYICNHHGSSSSSSESFVKALAPEYTVISCGKDNDYGHPSKKVLTNLSGTGTALYRTDTQGDIRFTFSGNGVEFLLTPTDNWEPGVYVPK